MNNAFFIVEPIFWKNPFSLQNFLIAIFCTIIFLFMFFLFKKQKQWKKILWKKQKNVTYILPEISDTLFLSKLFFVLQNFVKDNFLPQNTLAHTSYDIAKYCNNKKILSLYAELEQGIFQNLQFSHTEKIAFKNMVHEIITQKNQ